MSLQFTNREEEQIIMMFSIIHKIMKVTLKDNVYDILEERDPGEYDEDDKRYFESLLGEEFLVYNYDNSFDHPESDSWFILLDDNVPFTENCFNIIKKYI